MLVLKSIYDLFIKMIKGILFSLCIILNYQQYKIEGKYNLIAQASNVSWICSSEIGDYSIKGTVGIKDGELIIKNNIIESGSIVINMNSIKCNNISGFNKIKLINHLKSEDFFYTDKFPFSSFVIKKNQKLKFNEMSLIEGVLSIKDISKSTNYPLNILIKNDTIIIKGIISFDRSTFDVKYGSVNFFKNLGDNAISNTIKLDLNIKAVK